MSLIEEAVGQLGERIDLTVDVRGDHLEIKDAGRQIRFHTHVVPHLTDSVASTRVSEWGRDDVVITEHISSGAARLLRNQDVGYIDHVGNCFLRRDGLYVLIEDKKGYSSSAISRPDRAFKKSGLKVIFLLLQKSGLINEPYRTIGDHVGVSHGTVRYVLEDLEKLGYVEVTSTGERLLSKRNDLIKRWAERYGEALRPRLLRGRYRSRYPSLHKSWKDISLDPECSLWGGEVAADYITGMLKPETVTLYTREDTSNVLKKLKAVPDPKGDIEILDMFWQGRDVSTRPEGDAPVVPPLLAYADLVASAAPRNVEIGDLIYERYLSDQ
jgi:hypothetical protein